MVWQQNWRGLQSAWLRDVYSVISTEIFSKKRKIYSCIDEKPSIWRIWRGMTDWKCAYRSKWCLGPIGNMFNMVLITCEKLHTEIKYLPSYIGQILVEIRLSSDVGIGLVSKTLKPRPHQQQCRSNVRFCCLKR